MKSLASAKQFQQGTAVRSRGPARVAGRGSVCVRALHSTDPKKRVVVTGMGVCSVFGNDPEVYYDKLLAGVSGISLIEGFDASEYPTRFAGEIKNFDTEDLIPPKEARRLDTCWKYTLVSGNKAMMMAGFHPKKDQEAFEKLDRSRVGVLVGTGIGGMSVFANNVETQVTKGFKRISPFFIPYAITNMGSGLLAMEHGFMGPNYSVSTACATANYAFHLAASHIRAGEADVMICGGAEAPVNATGLGGFVACRALSSRNEDPTKASRPWDNGRDGFVLGEGAGVLVFESMEHAMKRGANILCEYLGGAFTCDAYNITDPHPEGLGVATCIELALKDAKIDRDMVNYINCHATSTIVGDKAEIKAVKRVFTDTKNLHVNATKSMIGHGLGAAAGLEAIAAIQAIRRGKLHPTLNQEDLIEEVAGIDTCPEARTVEVTAAMSNSFGFGGHNSSCIFAPFKA